MMGLTPAEQDVDVEVRYDDQLQINEFGRLNQDKNELQNELDEMKRKMDNYTQAEEELDELECFVDEEEKGSAKYVGSYQSYLLLSGPFVTCAPHLQVIYFRMLHRQHNR
eukprot:gb/GECG01016241.1/.p1 GENE.gb/GECG01016241.1/~~gb/GECG01016241.1/.p1  ORF type:complete len:110 (+),score=17.03 gb/GECG01016241.1/:1-330(+)